MNIPDIIRSLKGRIHFAHVRNLQYNGYRDFQEAAHLSADGSMDMYEIMKALYDIGFDGIIRPDHEERSGVRFLCRDMVCMTVRWVHVISMVSGKRL